MGLRATLNTDDPGVSNCTLTDEYVAAVYQLGLGYRELRHMTLNAAHAAFLPEPARSRLVAHFEKLLPIPGSNANLPFQSGGIPFLYSSLD